MAKLLNKGRTIQSESEEDEEDELEEDVEMEEEETGGRNQGPSSQASSSSSMSSPPSSPNRTASTSRPLPPPGASSSSSSSRPSPSKKQKPDGAAFKIKLKLSSDVSGPSSPAGGIGGKAGKGGAGSSSMKSARDSSGKGKGRAVEFEEPAQQDEEELEASSDDDDEEEELEEEDELEDSDNNDTPAATALSDDDIFSDSEQEEDPADRRSRLDPFANSHLTARQRAAQGDMSLSGELLELPAEFKGFTLTEAEREARRAETARRRKNQSEKKLEDDKIETINRLLKSQSSRSRGAARSANPSQNLNDSPSSRAAAALPPPPPTIFRSIISIKTGTFQVTLSAPEDPVYLAKLAGPTAVDGGKKREGGKGICRVEGCVEERKYRVIGGGSMEWEEGWGGCGVEHLKVVQAMVKGRKKEREAGEGVM